MRGVFTLLAFAPYGAGAYDDRLYAETSHERSDLHGNGGAGEGDR